MEKSFRSHLSAAVALLLTVFVFASCSDSPSDLVNYVPKESKAVMVFKPGDLAKKGNLEKYVKKFPKEKFGEAAEFIKTCMKGESGIDMEQMVLFEYEGDGYLSFVISDESKFEKLDLIADNTTKGESGGLTTYEADSKGAPSVVVDGSKAWLCPKNLDDGIDAVKTFIALDKEKSVAEAPGFADNMSDGDMNIYINMEEIMSMGGGMTEQMMNKEMSRYGLSLDDMNIKEYFDSHIYLTVLFEKDKLSVKCKCLDGKGENIVSKVVGNKTIDTGMLKFFDKSTTMVYASVIPDYVKKMYSNLIESTIYDETQKAIVEEIFKNLDDNVAFGISISGNLTTKVESEWGSYDKFNQKSINGTMVAKCKKSLEADVATLASILGLPIATDGSVSFPIDSETTVRIKSEGNYLVVSTTAAPSQPLADPGMFGGKSAAMFVNLSKTSPASQSIKRAFGIDLDLTAISYSDKQDNLFELKVNNNKQDNVLAYLVDLVLKVSEI